jgi:hypothetical protein
VVCGGKDVALYSRLLVGVAYQQAQAKPSTLGETQAKRYTKMKTIGRTVHPTHAPMGRYVSRDLKPWLDTFSATKPFLTLLRKSLTGGVLLR